ncbi:hypothetical protein Gorai_013492, partial [Gossypium raimondii]|nr:hypothetical protein [Gossypium raimondii]
MLTSMVVCHKVIPSLFAAEAHACYQVLRFGVRLGLDSITHSSSSYGKFEKGGRFLHGWGHSELCVTSNREEKATEPGLNEKGKWVSSKKW